MGERFLKSRSHVAAATYEDYEWKVGFLQDELGVSMPVDLIREADIRAFCFRSDVSRATQTTYLRFCKMFFKWLTDEGHVKTNVCERIKYPKKQHKVAEKSITEDELHEIFRAFKRVQRERILDGKQRGLHVWFKPMVATFFYAGLRRKEAINLEWEHVDLERAYIHISKTKSGQERIVPIQQALMPYLKAWHRYSGRPEGGAVFFNRRRGNKRFPLTPDNVTKTFKKYVRAANLPDTVHLHGLRHSCATELLRSGLGINEVASILGHSSLEVTRIYEHLNEHDLKRKMRNLGL